MRPSASPSRQVFRRSAAAMRTAGGNYRTGRAAVLDSRRRPSAIADEIGSIVVGRARRHAALIRDIAETSISSVPRKASRPATTTTSGHRHRADAQGGNPSEVLTESRPHLTHSTRPCCRKALRIVWYYDRSILFATTLTTFAGTTARGT